MEIFQNYWEWIFLLILSIYAYFQRNYKINIFVIALILLRVTFPYYSMDSLIRSLIKNSYYVTAEQDAFKDALSQVSAYIEKDTYVVLGATIVIIVLCIKGFKK